MTDSPRVVAVLDACVLAPMPIADTLLRLAEKPNFYSPRWSLQILEELARTLAKFGRTPSQIDRRIHLMKAEFPEALVEDFEHLIPHMGNDPKDRHVLAVAVNCGASVIVSDNQRHFPVAALSPYELRCVTADVFFASQFRIDPEAFLRVLEEQAASIRWTIPQLLARHTPSLSRLIKAEKARPAFG